MEISTATCDYGDQNQLSSRIIAGVSNKHESFHKYFLAQFYSRFFIFYYTLEIVKAKLGFPSYSLQNKQIKVYVGMV